MHNYYQILGLQPGATRDQIKRAYRKLAMQYHPDVNAAADAKERFMRISEAYNYLMDPPKRVSVVESYEQQSRAEAERVKRAKAAATEAARQRYRAVKRKREIDQGRAYSRGISALIAIVCLVVALIFGSRYLNKWYVNQNPEEVVATVLKRGARHIWLGYEVNGEQFTKKVSGSRSKFLLVAANGLPVFAEEQFVLVYRKDNPTRSYVDFERITPQTMDIYLDLLKQPVSAQFNVPLSDPRLECLCLLTFEEFGFDGLANLFFWQEHPLENFSNNRWTCATMVEDTVFKQVLQNCLILESASAEEQRKP